MMTPGEFQTHMAATFSYVDSRSFLELATVAANAANTLKEKAAKEPNLARKEKLLSAARKTKKRSNNYVLRYMAGEVYDPKPSL